MAEHDYNIANQTFPATRSDINDVLAAIMTNNSKATAPSTTAPYMFWADTATGFMKQRNAADSAWITLYKLADNGLIAQNGTAIFAEDAGASDTYAITLSPVPTALTNGMMVNFIANTLNTGAATLNVNSLGAVTIKKNVSGDLETGDIIAGQAITVIYDQTNNVWQVLSPLGRLEGTFTPVLTFATPGNLSVTYDTQSAFYTKVGRKVTVCINVDTATFTHTTASGNLQITGLPFTSLSTAGYRSSGKAIWTGITKAGYTEIAANLEAGQTIVTFQASGSALAVSNVTAADMPTTSNVQLFITLTYFTA